MKRDPHSPILDGTENAFAFFESHDEVEEEFVPVHFNANGLGMRIMDTWSWLFVFGELCASYHFLGVDGLFLAYTSGWVCQTITLWFNVVNHPPDGSKPIMDPMGSSNGSTSSAVNTTAEKEKAGVTDDCKASNGKDSLLEDFYIPFMLLDALVPLFSIFVKESEHQDHHNHAKLAKRSKYDIAYWGFVWPLEQLGLVWNTVV